MLDIAETIQPRVVRYYTEQERQNAVAVYDNTGNLELASETLGIPKSTLHGWLQDPSYPSDVRIKKAQSLADKFENAAHTFIDLAVKKAKKAPVNHLATAAGIAVDKMQLLRGQPTNITANVERTELTVILAEALGEQDER